MQTLVPFLTATRIRINACDSHQNVFVKIKGDKRIWRKELGTSNYRTQCGFELDLTGVMNGASPIHDIQAQSHQCLWATARYGVINHATWAGS